MPCTYEPTRDEIEASHNNALRNEQRKNKRMQTDLDRLTHEGDMLREAIIGMVDDGTLPSPDVMALIEKNQIEHRKQDLRRLEKTFRKLKDPEKLGKVMLADPEKPLAAQLGFDPDAY